MTTIDHQQAAIDAAMPVMRRRDRCPNDSDCLACKAGVGQILTAAAPHLRAAWAADLVEKIKAEINDVDWDYGLNADAYLNGLRRVIALLEGGDNQ